MALMETCNDDIILAISSLLLPRDLANLAFVCKRLGTRNNAAVSPMSNIKSASSKQRRQQQEGEGTGCWPWSIIEEASRRQVSMAKNDKNNRWRDSDLITIRGEESWMAVHHRLHLLQSSLAFGRIVGSSIRYVDGDITRIQGRRTGERVGFSVAICQRVMKVGVHFVEFAVMEVGGSMGFGIIRPIDDHPKKRMKHDEFRAYCNMRRHGNQPGYEGDIHQYYEQTMHLERGDVIGTILDLDASTLTVYKNGECLGVKIRNGLAGHYCWAVTMDRLGSSRPSVRIRPSNIDRQAPNWMCP
jgi:hypothetical protein